MKRIFKKIKFYEINKVAEVIILLIFTLFYYAQFSYFLNLLV
jgi:hypothetical protein